MNSAFQIVQERLLNIIQTQKFENNKLNSEDELVKLLDASRGTVREVLRSLVRKGVVSKKHGIGNFVHPRALDMKMRIDEIGDFIHLIENGGYKATLVKDRELFEYTLPAQDAPYGLDKFLQKEMTYLCFTRVYLADGEPAVYCQLFFPKHFFANPPFGEGGYGNLFHFVQANFNQEVDQTMIWIGAESANEELAEKLDIPVGTAILVWDEVFCNYKDETIGFSKTHFNPKIMNVCMLRTSP